MVLKGVDLYLAGRIYLRYLQRVGIYNNCVCQGALFVCKAINHANKMVLKGGWLCIRLAASTYSVLADRLCILPLLITVYPAAASTYLCDNLTLTVNLPYAEVYTHPAIKDMNSQPIIDADRGQQYIAMSAGEAISSYWFTSTHPAIK